MATQGIVLLGEDKRIAAKAKLAHLDVIVDASMPLAFDKTLFVSPGTPVPWDLLPAGWRFLDHWDGAVPLFRYGATADTLGSDSERKATAAVVRDLRVLTHSVELLFVRDNEDGRALMEAYRREIAAGGERRLAFLRAYYQTKPRLCVLPVTWLADVRERSQKDARSMRSIQDGGVMPLARVEIAPGRFVKCRAGEEARILRQYEQRSQRRSERLKR